MATLGIATETITTAGWVLSTDAVTAILPQVSEFCGSLPASAPVVIYCLDNSSFCCANSEGQLSAITKQKDGLYHVPGELVVVHEVNAGGGGDQPEEATGGLRGQDGFHHHP
jgi:hypothetical protein